MVDYPHQYFGGQSYSQHGEDMAVAAIFHRLQIERPTFIDLGAHHPWELSNTALLYKRGSRGVCVEANPYGLHRFWEERPEDRTVGAAVVSSANPGDKVLLHRASHESGVNSTVIENLDRHCHMDSVEVDAVTLPQIVQWYAGDRWPDFLSIDVEGRDVEVLRTVRASECRVICIEAISQIGDVSGRIREWCMENDFGVHSWWGGNMLLVSNRYGRKLC